MLSMVPSSTLVKLYSPWSDILPPRVPPCQSADGRAAAGPRFSLVAACSSSLQVPVCQGDGGRALLHPTGHHRPLL